MICDVIARLAEGVDTMQARAMVSNRAAPGVLGEALMALVFHAAAAAQCPADGDHLAVRARAEQLLHEMTGALLGV